MSKIIARSAVVKFANAIELGEAFYATPASEKFNEIVMRAEKAVDQAFADADRHARLVGLDMAGNDGEDVMGLASLELKARKDRRINEANYHKARAEALAEARYDREYA